MTNALESIDRQINALQARRARIRARERERARRLEARRDLLLGRALRVRARSDEAAASLVRELVESLADPRERAAFEGEAREDAREDS